MEFDQISQKVARQFSTGTKFGNEKGKVQKPARIPPQTPPAGGKKAEAGQFHSPRKIVCPAESKLVFRIFVKKCSNINQKTPPILVMDIKKIEKFLTDDKYPKYRLKQIKKAVFCDLIDDWKSAAVLPNDLRDVLEKKFPISGIKISDTLTSKKQDAIKAVFVLNDGNAIETVLMKHSAVPENGKTGRNTICVSSQAGCPMQCSFCGTGQAGFKRNLSSEEIVGQVLFFARMLKKSGDKVDNIVFMGMGEPFLNYDNVIEAIEILNDKDGFNLGIRHISISTCGIIPAIKKFAEENLQCNLAISLHTADDKKRTMIMPVNKVYPLSDLMKAVGEYIEKTNRKVMFEYLLLDGFNDGLEDAEKLANLMKNNLYHINLIKYHDTGSGFKPSPLKKRKIFFDFLKKKGVSVTFRVSFGEDILAACGQLAGKIVESV